MSNKDWVGNIGVSGLVGLVKYDQLDLLPPTNQTKGSNHHHQEWRLPFLGCSGIPIHLNLPTCHTLHPNDQTVALPETNSKRHLKMDGLESGVLVSFRDGQFSGVALVSGGVFQDKSLGQILTSSFHWRNWSLFSPRIEKLWITLIGGTKRGIV